MKKTILGFAFFVFSCVTQAALDRTQTSLISEFQRNSIAHAHTLGVINWKVGDWADYNVDFGFPGTMHMVVREEITEGFWVNQDVELMGQTQKIEILIDKNDGSILQLIVNGEKQDPPKKNIEIIESKQDKVTVPKGTFECIYLKIKDVDSGEISEIWANPSEIPVFGMIKSIMPTPFGQEATIELTDFLKQ